MIAGAAAAWAWIKQYAGLALTVLLVGAVSIYIGALRLENTGLQRDKAALTTQTVTLATEKAQLEADIKTLEALRQLDAEASRTLAETLTREGIRNSEMTSRLKEIESAPPTDDGPVSPVLRRALERLPHGL